MTNLMPDISNHQPALTPANAAKVKASCGAILFKCSQGIDFIDGNYRANVTAAESAGLPYNAYHAASADAAAKQIAHIMTAIQGTSPAAIVVDWEQWQSPQTTAPKPVADALCHGLQLAFPTHHIVEYCGVWAREHGGPYAGIQWIMVPAYGYANVDVFVPPGFAAKLAAWQYTNGTQNGTPWPQVIPGIGPCDVSYMYKPEVFGVAAPKPPPPPPKPRLRGYAVGPEGGPTKRYRLYLTAARAGLVLLKRRSVPKITIERVVV